MMGGKEKGGEGGGNIEILSLDCAEGEHVFSDNEDLCDSSIHPFFNLFFSLPRVGGYNLCRKLVEIRERLRVSAQCKVISLNNNSSS